MSTRMDENTVSANFVTFVNCLSYPEKKCITEFLFSEALNKNPIKSESKIDWEISYHTNIGDGCEPDITININQEKYFLEVKTRIGTGLTQTEVKGGARENLFKDNIKKHVYLLPEEYKEKYSDQLIDGCPVITWNELFDEIMKNDIDGQKFFKEIGKYIDYFSNEFSYEFNKREVFLMWNKDYIKDYYNLLKKLKTLIEKTKDDILANLKAKNSNINFVKLDGSETFCWLNYNGKTLGYGFDPYVLNHEDGEDYLFSVFFDKNICKINDNDSARLFADQFQFIKLPDELLIKEEEELKNCFIESVVELITSHLK